MEFENRELFRRGFFTGRYLSLNGLNALTAGQTKKLGKRRGSVSLNGIKQLDANCADNLSYVQGMLSLNGLETLDDEAARCLEKHSGGLSLDGLRNISDATAESLGKIRGDLSLRGLESLTVAQARYLSEHSDGTLCLSGIRELSDDVAEELSHHKGFRLDLSGLTAISDASARSLSSYCGHVLELNGLTEATSTVVDTLKRHRAGRLELGATAFAPETPQYANETSKLSCCLTNSIGMKFLALGSGTYVMGGSEEFPAHEVTLEEPFYLGVYPVTQEQYERVMNKNGSSYISPLHPVESVSWNDAVEFCKRLSEMPEEQSANRIYRLPNEAEWEYACRAGTSTAYSFGDDESDLGEYAWYSSNSALPELPEVKRPTISTRPVGSKKPNAWGFFDMHGNVAEWVQDIDTTIDVSDPKWSDSVLPVDPDSPCRVRRGGSFWNDASHCTSTVRLGNHPGHLRADIGFRVAISVFNGPGKQVASFPTD